MKFRSAFTVTVMLWLWSLAGCQAPQGRSVDAPTAEAVWKPDPGPSFDIEVLPGVLSTRWHGRLTHIPRATKQFGAFDDSAIRSALAVDAESWVDASGGLNIVLTILPQAPGSRMMKICPILDEQGERVGAMAVDIHRPR